MNAIRLYHGSQRVVSEPRRGVGNPFNDYGLGFYCTESFELACEWAAPDITGGFANEYEFAIDGLALLDLSQAPYGALDWLSVLIEHRRFDSTTALMGEAMAYLRERHAVNLEPYDVVKGWRADDSYFSFARAFLDNRISLQQLQRAMALGSLGEQIVLRSKRAFDHLRFVEAHSVDGENWHSRRIARDDTAREEYRSIIGEPFAPDNTYILDLLREA